MLLVPSALPANSTSEDINLPSNILLLVGPILIGNLLGWALLGVLTMQLYVYYLCFPRDAWWVKFTVYGLYLLDLVQTVFVTDVAWAALCAGWGNRKALVYTPWGFSMTPIASGLISGWVEIFFAWRLWSIGRNTFWKAVTAVISAIALTQGGAAIAVGINFSRINNIERITELESLTCVWLGGSAVADVIIAAGMVYLLISAKRKTWNKTTDRRITQLIRTTVETGVLSATAASLDLGLYLAYSRNNLHVTIATVLSKLYSNALMASLNSRAGIYQRALPSVSREDERYSTPGHFERDQFTTIGVAMTVDGSASVGGTVVQDTKSAQGFVRIGSSHAGTTLANHSAV
ncbi:hypothetical protein BC826DRAFT_715853 [Russula brevipes]|nr:hypothetical protein BC826DRAFT_715853 [Russula brevipes]